MKRRLVSIILVLLIFSRAPLCARAKDGAFEVHYIDVGQADCSLIICDDKAMLIDGGNVGDRELVYSYLEKLGLKKLDYLVCTHAHEDHVGGLVGALRYAECGTVLAPLKSYDSNAFDDFLDALDAKNLELSVPETGYSFKLGTAVVEILGPQRKYENINNTSLVLRISYGESVFLFMGDAERESEDDILESDFDLRATVIKIGHHGSETSTGYRLLYECEPKVAIISCGLDNKYGHPHDAVLSRLRDADIKSFRTDLDGTIICESDGDVLQFRSAAGESFEYRLPEPLPKPEKPYIQYILLEKPSKRMARYIASHAFRVHH
ncbi:MAG: ComEC/Rec2 family competence protein [Oscillospiraceae bacterium]